MKSETDIILFYLSLDYFIQVYIYYDLLSYSINSYCIRSIVLYQSFTSIYENMNLHKYC